MCGHGSGHVLQEIVANKFMASGKKMTFFYEHIVFTPQFRHRIALIVASSEQHSVRSRDGSRQPGQPQPQPQVGYG
jgi:hypothetical protein